MKFSIKVFFSKCDQIRCSLRIWSHLLKKSSMENFSFCAVLCQLIECDIGNIFLEKPYTKYGGETIPRPFSKKLKSRISLYQQSKVSHSFFLLYTNLMAIKLYLNKAADHLILPHTMLVFFSKKEVQNQSRCFVFCIIFEENYFSCFIQLTNHISWTRKIAENIDDAFTCQKKLSNTIESKIKTWQSRC